MQISKSSPSDKKAYKLWYRLLYPLHLTHLVQNAAARLLPGENNKTPQLKNPLVLSRSLLSVSFDILICLVCSLFSVHFYLAAVPFTYIAEFFF